MEHLDRQVWLLWSSIPGDDKNALGTAETRDALVAVTACTALHGNYDYEIRIQLLLQLSKLSLLGAFNILARFYELHSTSNY